MTATRPPRQVLGTALRRFGTIGLLVGIVCGLLATQLVQRMSTPTFTAEGTFVVPIAPPAPQLPEGADAPESVDPRPSSAYDAERLARNYAAIIGQDGALLNALTGPTGMSVEDLTSSIAAVNLPSSSVIRVTFTADREEQVMAYFTAMRDVVSAPTSPTPNLAATTLQPLRLPTKVIAQPGLAPVAPFVGAVAGLLIGLAAAVLLERSLAQVRSASDVRALVRWPVLGMPRNAPGERYETIVLRVLDGARAVRQVAVAPVSGISTDAAAEFARDLREAEVRLRRGGRIPAAGAPVAWQAVGRVPDNGAAERAVQDADAVVLAMPAGARLRSATAALNRLQDLAARSVLVVVGAPRRPVGRRRTEAAPGDGSADRGGEPGAAGTTTDGVRIGARAQ